MFKFRKKIEQNYILLYSIFNLIIHLNQLFRKLFGPRSIDSFLFLRFRLRPLFSFKLKKKSKYFRFSKYISHLLCFHSSFEE